MSGVVLTLTWDAPGAELREALRYMGCRGDAPPATERLAQRALQKVLAAATPRCCYARIPIRVEADEVELGFRRVCSKALARNLAGCAEAFLFAATLGAGVDRAIAAAEAYSAAEALAADAAGSAAAESWCAEANRRLARLAAGEGMFLRPRFSPGYGDFPLDAQRELLSVLDAPRRIGLSMSEGLMLLPVKSVTALIGICPDRPACPDTSCETCEKQNCPYRA